MLWNEKFKLNTCKKCSIFRLAIPKNGHPCGVKGMESNIWEIFKCSIFELALIYPKNIHCCEPRSMD
jgi:hypothetical protein